MSQKDFGSVIVETAKEFLGESINQEKKASGSISPQDRFAKYLFEETPVEKVSADLKLKSCLSKFAGFDIYQPTPANVEAFVKRYFSSELKNLNDVPFSTGVELEYERGLKNGDISEKSQENLSPTSERETINGIFGVRLPKLSESIEVPFVVIDGEFVPPDVIQFNKQRVPYSRENLFKVIHGVFEQSKKEGKIPGFEPYKGTADAINPTSSTGFLGDVLRIQEQYSNRGAGGNLYVTAKELDDLMEKVSSMKLFDEESKSSLSKIVEKATNKAYMRKFASENDMSEIEKLSALTKQAVEKLASVNWENAATLANGTPIVFPEVKGKSLEMTPAVVVGKYIRIGNSDIINNEKQKMIITSDGRGLFVKQGDQFLCARQSSVKFDIKTSSLSSLEGGSIITAFKGDEALPLMRVERVQRIKVRSTLSSDGGVERTDDDYCVSPNEKPVSPASVLNVIKTYYMRLVSSDYSDLSEAFNADKKNDSNVGDYLEYGELRLQELNGKKFDSVPVFDFLNQKSNEVDLDKSDLSRIYGTASTRIVEQSSKGDFRDKVKESFVFCTDPETRVIVLKGTISNFVHTAQELEKFVNYELGEEKIASSKEYVDIQKTVDGSYNVKIAYIDKKERLFKSVYKQFDNVSVSKMQGILKSLNFEANQVAEITVKADKEKKAHMELPAGADPSIVFGAPAINEAKQSVNQITGLFNNKEINNMISGGVAENWVYPLLENATGPIGDAITTVLTSIASQDAECGEYFEKIAVEHQSEYMQEIAKLMYVGKNIAEKTASVCKGSFYPKLKDTCSEILDLETHMSKTASELLDLKSAQIRNKNEIVPMNVIQNAVVGIDNLYKMAYLLNENLK